MLKAKGERGDLPNELVEIVGRTGVSGDIKKSE